MSQEESVLRLGRDCALETTRLWQEYTRVRVQGAGQRDERADGLPGPADVRRGPQRARRRQENSRNGYRPRSRPPWATWSSRYPSSGTAPTTPRACSRAGLASTPRWPPSCRRCTCAACPPASRARGVQAGHILAVERRSNAPTSTTRWPSSAAGTCRERRAATCGWTPPMSCRVGSSVVSQGVVTAIGLGADGQALLGCDVVDTESEDSGRPSSASFAGAGWPACAS